MIISYKDQLIQIIEKSYVRGPVKLPSFSLSSVYCTASSAVCPTCKFRQNDSSSCNAHIPLAYIRSDQFKQDYPEFFI